MAEDWVREEKEQTISRVYRCGYHIIYFLSSFYNIILSHFIWGNFRTHGCISFMLENVKEKEIIDRVKQQLLSELLSAPLTLRSSMNMF